MKDATSLYLKRRREGYFLDEKNDLLAKDDLSMRVDGNRSNGGGCRPLIAFWPERWRLLPVLFLQPENTKLLRLGPPHKSELEYPLPCFNICRTFSRNLPRL